jgi:hypothetical protein
MKELHGSTSGFVPDKFPMVHNLAEREHAALTLVREFFKKHNRPVTATELENKLGLQGGSRQRVIGSLIEKGAYSDESRH